jgi:endoglucanase
VKPYEGPIDYPGELLSPEQFDALPVEAKDAIGDVRAFDAGDIERRLEPVLALGAETGLPLWCGEFGALGTTPEPARERWYRDVLETLRRHEIPWTVWDIKGDFGVFDSEGRETEVARFLRAAMP